MLSLVDKQSRFGAKSVVVTVCQVLVLSVIEVVPSRTSVNTTSRADLDCPFSRRYDVVVLRVTMRGAVDGYGRGRRPPEANSDRSARHLGGGSYKICLSHSTCQREVGLLEVLHIKLESIQARVVDDVVHPMDNGLGGPMIFAPYCC
jgi:hypothetical protein